MEREINLNWHTSYSTSSINDLFGTPKAENSQKQEELTEENQIPIALFDYQPQNPIINQEFSIQGKSEERLMETYELEVRASAIYTCMAGKTKDHTINKMYKRLAKIELEHAEIVTKLLNMPAPEAKLEECSDEDLENFKKTIELEKSCS